MFWTLVECAGVPLLSNLKHWARAAENTEHLNTPNTRTLVTAAEHRELLCSSVLTHRHTDHKLLFLLHTSYSFFLNSSNR